MDLTAALLRAAAARPHVLVASMPGGTPVRLALNMPAAGAQEPPSPDQFGDQRRGLWVPVSASSRGRQ
ncbi:hypothetical protein [Nonomuraea wenchangensis]|uniref:hypothetical protein n=1 Tax=Nonomuraea wenchangensis TaxID=568860 RepID=UPI003327BB0B